MNTDCTRDTLAEIESKIKSITGDNIDNSDCWIDFQDQREEVRSLLASRQSILNNLFKPTPENMQRFCMINHRLYFLTQQLFCRFKNLEVKLPVIMECPDFDDDFELEGTLRYCFNGEDSVLKFDDDVDYGSNFTLMIKLISDLFHDIVLENIEEIHTLSHPLDDGQSWNEYPFIGRPEFENIIICHAVHQLTDHQLYSIPDLIRLNDFWAEVHLTIQSITEQDGTRFIPNKKTLT